MYNMKKSLLAMLMALLVVATGVLPAFAEDIPYDTYNYDYWNDIFRTPAAYVPQGSLLGTDLQWNGVSLGAFNAPQDLFVAKDGNIYLADTKNHRIIVLDNDLRTVVNVITSFENAGMTDCFNEPLGIAVTAEGMLYVADSMNRRIVVLDAEGKLNRIVEIPAQAASQKIGTTTYTVGTYVEGMGEIARLVQGAQGESYFTASVPAGSAAEVKDENGLTYTVVAEEPALVPFQAEMIVGASVTGEIPAEAGDVLCDFVVKNGDELQLVSGVSFYVTDAKDQLRAALEVTAKDAQGSDAVRASYGTDGLSVSDAQGTTLVVVAHSGAISLYDDKGTAAGILECTDDAVVVKNAKDKELVTLKKDGGAIIFDSKNKELAVVSCGGAGDSVTDLEGTVTLLSQVDGDVELKDAKGKKNALLKKTAEGYAITDTKDVVLAVIGADGSVAARDAKGNDIAIRAVDGSVSVMDGAGSVLAVVNADGRVSMKDAQGAEKALVAADGSVTIRDGRGGDAAVLTRTNAGMSVKDGMGVQTVLLQQRTEGVLLKDLALNCSAGSRIHAVQADGSEVVVELSKGSYAYAAEQDGKSITRVELDGKSSNIARYDPDPQKDIFLLIGRLLKGPKTTGLTGLKSVWVDEDGYVYAVSDKSATKLSKDGTLQRVFGSYRNPGDTKKAITFTNITEFAVQDELVYIRDGANKVVVLNQNGTLAEVVASNAVQITDAQGDVVDVLTHYDGNKAFKDITGVELISDMLLIGQADGTVVITDRNGAFIDLVENDTVVKMSAEGRIEEKLTTAAVGKTTERFTGLTGVAMLDDQLCVCGADNRVLVLDQAGKAVQTAQNNCVYAVSASGQTAITGYEFGGEKKTFAAVNGVEGVALNNMTVMELDRKGVAKRTAKNQLCIADSEDNLIILDDEMKVVRVAKDPDAEVLEENYAFVPKKVTVDYAGRIYCIAKDMFEGIMVFETNGEFTGFFGTIQVSISAWDKFWRKLATKEERSKQQLFIPTEFTGIDIDGEGFVYATNVDTAGMQAVRRLNPKGEDVIRKGANANLGGDIAVNGTTEYAGVSRIEDVVYRDKGVYSLLDSKRSRIFTYDHEGNLLYIFGGRGTQEGTLTKPVAIEYAEDRLLVLDATQGSVLIFGETEYGRLINDAVALRYDGDESEAVGLWEQVLRLDENNELANTGIGKAYLSAGDNEKAMEYLKRGMNREYYSVAFKRYRNEMLKENIQYVLTGVMLFVALLVVWFKIVKPRIRAKREGRV